MRGTTIALAALLAAGGCGESTPFEPGSQGWETPTVAAVATEHGGTLSKSPLVTFADPEVAVGSSLLQRLPDGIRVRAATTALPPGTATTFWIVVFNNPEQCVDACDIPDVFAPDV